MSDYETDNWPFLQAKNFTKVTGKKRKVRLLVVHDMEYDENLKAAEQVAKYFSTTTTKASAHICVDADSIVQCVKDSDVAWAAPGCNNDGIQLEMAGYMKQTREQWLDKYGIQMLARAADAAAQYCLKYDLPIIHLTNAQLVAGGAGIIGHVQASQVYKRSDHQDPGPNFPWDYFMTQLNAAYLSRR